MKSIIISLQSELNALVENYKKVENEVKAYDTPLSDFWLVECDKILSVEEKKERYTGISKKREEKNSQLVQMKLAILNVNNAINNLRISIGESYKVMDEKNYSL